MSLMNHLLGRASKSFHWLCLISLLSMIFTGPVVAQVENLSKIPNLDLDINQAKDYTPIVMPDDYPEELTSFFDNSTESRSFVVVDVETNRILAQRGANIPYPIASMTKILTAYLVYKAIDEGKLTLKTEVEAPADLTKVLSENYELSATPLVAGEKYTVNELLHALIMMSGNDAASLLMREIYGSESAATQAMIDQLTTWGFIDFSLYTTSGVPNEYLPEDWRMSGSAASNENVMSAQDLALMAQYIIKEYPEILDISSKDQYEFKKDSPYAQIFYTTNSFLPGKSLERDGITGLKSGSTQKAGDCFVATGKENGREIIAVSMGIFTREDGTISSPYNDLDLILDALKENPDLYKNDKLPTNLLPSLEERQAIEASKEAEAAAANEDGQDESKETTLENKRDNPITNFIGKLFDFLR